MKHMNTGLVNYADYWDCFIWTMLSTGTMSCGLCGLLGLCHVDYVDYWDCVMWTKWTTGTVSCGLSGLLGLCHVD